MSGLGWTPQEGDQVELRAHNRWQLPRGTYELARGAGGFWHLQSLTTGEELAGIPPAHLIASESAETLRVIDQAEREKRRVRVQLKSTAPMRGVGPQHDESDLALFRSADERELDL